MNSIRMRWNFYVIIALLFSYSSIAQTVSTGIKITYPESRAVFQRDNDNTTTLSLSGSYYQPVDSLQVRLLAEVAGQGINTPWRTFQRSAQGGVFQGSVKGTGGWYRLEVQAFYNGSVVATDVIRKIGIGEVFIITGQSNAQGFQDFGAVGAADDRVNCVSYNNTLANSLGDPPAPVFEQLSATSVIGMRGQSAWCWGRLGDLLAQQYNVPVLFINTAWAGTTIRNWIESFDDKVTKNIFALGTPNENLPRGMPYANLRIALRYYCSLQGLRAILWHQGETDNVPLNLEREEYRRLLQSLVDKTRTDTNRYPAWILARASRNGSLDGTCFNNCNGNQDCIDKCPYIFTNSEKITSGQTDIINSFSNNVYAGPFTDNIQPNRPDGVHFTGDGLIQLAQAWYQSMSPVFFASSIPLLPTIQPLISVACGPSENSVNVTLPAGYSSYTWRTGQTGRNLTITQPGQYQATLKNADGNTFLSPTIDVRLPIQPVVPVVSVARREGVAAASQQQICADSVLSLVAGVTPQSAAQWSNGINQRILNVGNPGTYSVRAVNIYGCRSASSPGITLTVRPKLATPTIEKIGVYSLQATLPAYPNNEQFDWRRGSAFLNNQNGAVAKAVLSGPYTARAKATFTLAGVPDLTCYSNFSNEVLFESTENSEGLSVYPNPSANGYIAVETIEDLQNVDLTVHTLGGQLVFSTKVPSFNERKLINVSGLTSGQYIVRLKTAGFDVAKRVLVIQ
ncbi:sialate O-acetylesterase [Fibrella aquatica]|jgi:Carbohydrate esterase, sialic acid-specific acetylesterase/Secretion system C-terminal sorting domain|uniref:sialate O-acetylesterase n=1 Tax=Fibrella aquatica TaxID=3242487 RepID=UPI00352270A7